MAKNKLITSGGLFNQPPAGYTILLTQANRWHKDIGDFRKAVSAAESIEQPSRVKLYDLYTTALLDTHLTSVLAKRKADVLSRKIEFTREGKTDEKMAELIASPWFSKFLSDVLDTPWWGFSLFQFFTEKDGWMAYQLVPRKHVDPIRELITKRQGDIEGIPWAEYPDLLPVGEKRDLGNLMKGLPWALYKTGAAGDWAQYAELFGQPIREYVYNGAIEEERLRVLKDAQEDTGGSATYIHSSDSTMNILSQGMNGNGELYEKFVSVCNAEISKLVLGNTLTTEQGQKGARSLGEVHVKEEKKLVEEDKGYLLNVLNYQMTDTFTAFGFNTKGGKFSFIDPKDPNELNLKMQIYIALMDKGLPVDDDEIYETFGIKKPDNYEELKAQQQQQQQPPPPNPEPPEPSDPGKPKDPEKKPGKPSAFRSFFA
ncbi:MAG: hypothetical protein MdMp024_0915 [Bacteroidales bacterium]